MQATGSRPHVATRTAAARRPPATSDRAADDFDEAHHRRRVEEVEPEDSLRPACGLGDRADRERARVRREDRVGCRCGIERPEDRPLELEVLERGLDDDAGLGTDRVERMAVPEPGQAALDPLVDRVRVQVELRGSPGEAVADPCPPALDRGLVDVVEDDLVAGLERELGDARAHRPGADDPDDLLGHGWSLGSGRIRDRLTPPQRAG